MDHRNEILKKYVAEQIAVEEHLGAKIRQELEEIGGDRFVDVKDILAQVQKILGTNYIALNKLMDKLGDDPDSAQSMGLATNGKLLNQVNGEARPKTDVSRFLREVYSDLTLITSSNTQLHTLGLALKRSQVAKMALKHMEQLVSSVLRIGEIIPDVLTRELMGTTPNIDGSAAAMAVANMKLVWRKA